MYYYINIKILYNIINKTSHYNKYTHVYYECIFTLKFIIKMNI